MKTNHAALRVIRKLSGYSQTDAAEMSGIDRPNYAHIEAGRRQGTDAQIVAIAHALNVPVQAIAYLDETTPVVAVAAG